MNPKKKFYLTLFFVSVILTLYGVWIGVFLFSMIKNVSAEYVQKQKDLVVLQKKGILIKEFEKELEKISPNLPKIDLALLKESEILGFVENLETIAKKTNNRHNINIINSSPEKVDGSISALNFRINLWGSLSSIFDFLNYLENQPVYLSIEDVQISRSGGGLSTSGDSQIPIGGDEISAILTVRVFAQ